MLPTKQKGNTLIYRENRLMWQDKKSSKNDRKQAFTNYFHLYFLSDDKIEDGDWKYCIESNTILRADTSLGNKTITSCCKYCKKIISATDSSLKVVIGDSGWKSADEGGWNEYKPEYKLLPQPSQDFINVFVEAYNKGNVIEHVHAEYERYKQRHGDGRQFIMSERLKINSKNEISIKKIKDTYTRDEVKNILIDLYDNQFDIDENRDDYIKWIAENL